MDKSGEFSMSRYYRERAAEYRALAAQYGRCPEDQQKAAGRRDALDQAAWYDRLADEEEANEVAE